jgi:hypothetical protein
MAFLVPAIGNFKAVNFDKVIKLRTLVPSQPNWNSKSSYSCHNDVATAPPPLG